MSYPTKEIREKCWGDRDKFFACLDQNDGETDNVPKLCEGFKKAFEENCPQQWVSHFARRRKFLQFKDKLEKGTADPIDLNDKK